MNFTCLYCGHGRFTVFFDIAGSKIATCNKCGNRMPLERQQTTISLAVGTNGSLGQTRLLQRTLRRGRQRSRDALRRVTARVSEGVDHHQHDLPLVRR